MVNLEGGAHPPIPDTGSRFQRTVIPATNPRRDAIAATEITREQYVQFLRENSEFGNPDPGRTMPP